MKYGVITFGYDDNAVLAQQLKQRGCYTVNLGDNAQSIAVRHVYRQAGISDEQMISINRDSLAHYTSEKAILIMNGVFKRHSSPVPENVIPIFVGFHTLDEDAIKENSQFFKKHEPIGCRDTDTTARLQWHGISAFTSGCLTLALPPRSKVPDESKLLIIYGSGAGAFPSQVLQYIPPHLAATAELIFHRLPVNIHPLPPEQWMQAEIYEDDIMNHYRNSATIVLTPLHHVCTPCMAMGIPVVVCRNDMDSRFSFLQSLLPIYTPDRFSEINWNANPVDVNDIRAGLLKMVRERLGAISSR